MLDDGGRTHWNSTVAAYSRAAAVKDQELYKAEERISDLEEKLRLERKKKKRWKRKYLQLLHSKTESK